MPAEQPMACPHCGGAKFEPAPQGAFRCVNQLLVNAVPPGASGNMGPAAIPIYGLCGTLFTRAAGQAKADEALARRREVEEAAAARAAADARQAQELQQRRESAVAELKALGPTALVPRKVLGRYRRTLLHQILSVSGQDELVEVEGAWPIGSFTWSHRSGYGGTSAENLPTGLTPSGRIVPMESAGKGDDVEDQYKRLSLAGQRGPNEVGNPAGGRRPARKEDIVAGLERYLEDLQRRSS